ncbi:uncharacterized protein BKA78DRAFT_181530 [Phyllosticta capitalensis]|uniref:uncharacterized protein n=1 Tax=Phyllosticta capitalensis TaxID=121624 RepID=UPI00313292E2
MVGRNVHIPASRTAYRHTKAANTINRSSNRPPLSLTHAVNLRLVLLSSQSSLSQGHPSIIYLSIPSTNQNAKMLASTITSALALFAAVASAAPSPAVAAPNVAAAPAVDLNAFKTKYYWNLTNLVSYSPGSKAYRTLGFTAAFSAQQNTTSCQSSNGVTGSFQPCDNPAVTFKADLGVNSKFVFSFPLPCSPVVGRTPVADIPFLDSRRHHLAAVRVQRSQHPRQRQRSPRPVERRQHTQLLCHQNALPNLFGEPGVCQCYQRRYRDAVQEGQLITATREKTCTLIYHELAIKPLSGEPDLPIL